MVPLRAFVFAKERLAGALDDDARAALVRRLAERVLDAAGELPTAVITSAPEVLTWAAQRGVTTLEDPGSLDAAAQHGRRWALDQGHNRVVVAHADLAHVRSFDVVDVHAGVEVITLVPDHRGDGTPVISLPTRSGFRFGYGPGSFRRHCAEVARLGAGLRVLRQPDLAFDVDIPSDLDHLTASTP